jgi:hypothetical protein
LQTETAEVLGTGRRPRGVAFGVKTGTVLGTVMVNSPLYRLLDVDIAAGKLAGTLTTVEFAEHALTTG